MAYFHFFSPGKQGGNFMETVGFLILFTIIVSIVALLIVGISSALEGSGGKLRSAGFTPIRRSIADEAHDTFTDLVYSQNGAGLPGNINHSIFDED